jgi:uncharacterized protein
MSAPRRDLGVGVGLRVPHYRHILEQGPKVDFFEIISENFLVLGGKPIHHLDRVGEHYALIPHGVSLAIGSPGDLDWSYLGRLKQLVRKLEPAWLSDHFCWGAVPGAHFHDLLPLPFTEEAVALVASRARVVQDYLEVPLALENASSYLGYCQTTMTEWQFVSEVAERADIGLLLDVNNVYVAAYNHGFDAYDFIRNVPHERILQIHLAGHTNLGKYIIDTHRGHVSEPVLELYEATIELSGAVSTLVEWDDEIPEFPALEAEANRVRALRQRALETRERLLVLDAVGGALASRMRCRSLRPTPVSAPSAFRSGESRPGWVQGGPREALGAETSVELIVPA